jgi:glycosyl transferase family 1
VTPRAVLVYQRPLPVHRGRRHPIDALLEARGHRVTDVADGPFDADSADVLLVLGNAAWFPTLRHELLRARRRPLVAIWHTEPLPLPRRAGVRRTHRHARELAKVVLRDPRANDPATNYRTLLELSGAGLPDLLMVGGRASQEFLAENGISAEWVTPGYHTSHGRDLGLRRDIDVMFLGATDVPRRRRLLRRLGSNGINVQVAGSWHDARWWGEERTRVLNRVRILLNIPRRPGELSADRLILGMANGALVVSEPIFDSTPYVPGEHYVSAAPDDFPRVITRFLADEATRARIAAVGQRFATRQVRFECSVSRLMSLIDERLSARARAPRAALFN